MRSSASGSDDDLLAQQRAAAALDQPQSGVNLVGAVEREVELEAAVELEHLDARRASARVCELGGDHRS